jgi:hypothetical protein
MDGCPDHPQSFSNREPNEPVISGGGAQVGIWRSELTSSKSENKDVLALSALCELEADHRAMADRVSGRETKSGHRDGMAWDSLLLVTGTSNSLRPSCAKNYN